MQNFDKMSQNSEKYGFNYQKKKKKPSRTVEPKQQNKRISKLEIIIRYRPNFFFRAIIGLFWGDF